MFENKVMKSGLLAFFLQLLLIGLAQQSAQAQVLYTGCDDIMNIRTRETIIESPEYPGNYPSQSSCRYRIVAPTDYVIDVSCELDIPITGTRCTTDRFSVSREGLTTGLLDYCGQRTLNFTCPFNRLTLAHSNRGGNGGKYRCTLSIRPECDCGWNINAKIAYGVETQKNQYPSMVALKDRQAPQGEIYCAATILSHNYLLTAAYCAALQPNASRIVALVGRHDITKGDDDTKYAGQYEISYIVKHSAYDASKSTFDIAVLATKTPIEWSRGVGPVCMLPQGTTNSFADQRVHLMGWGRTNPGSPFPATLRKNNMVVTENENCTRRIADRNIMVTDAIGSLMCIWDPRGLQKTCFRDAGGAIILERNRQFIVGINNNYQDCDAVDTMSVHNRISSHLQFIYATARGMCEKPLVL